MQASRIVARCSACLRPPEQIIERVLVDSCDVEYVARCHGSTQVVRVSSKAVAARSFGHFLGELADLFPHDGYPDMIELLNYNRQPWRFR